MKLSEMFLTELTQEAEITERFLTQLPDDKYDWQPHPKSMTFRQLVNHVAELPGWISFILATDELDFEKEPYQPNELSDQEKLLDYFRACVSDAKKALSEAPEEAFYKNWKLCAGELVFSDGPRWEMVRHSFNQLTHHRAQLGTYFRLLGLSVPSTYGGSVDDDRF